MTFLVDLPSDRVEGSGGNGWHEAAIEALLDAARDPRIPADAWERGLVAPLREFLARPGKSFRARMVEHAWRLTGMDSDPPVELSLLVEWIHAGSLIVDDIQDDSSHRRGGRSLHRMYGVPRALNLGNSLYFLPLVLFERMNLSPAVEVALFRRVSATMLRCHHGQALDLEADVLGTPRSELAESVALITEYKTAGLTELAAAMPPIQGGAADELVTTLAEFGRSVGMGLQMLNDLADLGGACDPAKRFEDLRNGRLTWPWAWLVETLSPVEFESLRRASRLVQQRGLAAEELAERMVGRLGSLGRDRVREHFAGALTRLRERLGDDVDLEPLAAEISRLEDRYA